MRVRGAARAVFAAVLLLVAGTLNIIYGIAGIGNANFYQHHTQYVFSNVKTWGWILGIGGAFPFWSLGVFALCVIVIHGLIVYGEPETA